MITDLSRRGELPEVVSDELDRLGSRLRPMVSGEFTKVTLTADRFFASAGAWTVNPNLSRLSFMRMGRFLVLDFRVDTSTVTATPAELRITLPAGMLNASSKSSTFQYLDNGTPGTGLVRAAVGLGYVGLMKNAAFVAWTASTLNTTVEGQVALEVKP